jgi:3-oxoacyl-[acyl-carrier protein] reductase
MPGNLEGKSAIVTGAARGIGQAIAVALASEAARVALVDVLDLNATAAMISEAGGTTVPLTVDVRDRAALAEAFSTIAARWEGIDILVTAAGIYGRKTRLEDLDDAEVDDVLAVNYKGTLWSAQAALPHMGDGGRIVCLGSVAGKTGGILAGPHYGGSKGAVHATTKWLAASTAKLGICVNGIAPGAIDTDMISGMGYSPDYCPVGRLGTPADVAGMVMYLVSSQASYVTGSVLDLSGGFLMG